MPKRPKMAVCNYKITDCSNRKTLSFLSSFESVYTPGLTSLLLSAIIRKLHSNIAIQIDFSECFRTDNWSMHTLVEAACSFWKVFDAAYLFNKFLENASKILHSLQNDCSMEVFRKLFHALFILFATYETFRKFLWLNLAINFFENQETFWWL